MEFTIPQVTTPVGLRTCGVVHSDVEYGLSSPDTGPDASDGVSSNRRRV